MSAKGTKNIIARVSLHNYRFPKNKAHVSGTYAIIIFNLLEVVDGEIPEEAIKEGKIAVVGNMPKIEEKGEYILSGKLVYDKKWGLQYECEGIRLAFDLSATDDQKKFFSFFLTKNQIDALFSQYDDPISILKAHNLSALTQIKGIGPSTASKICNKYDENINNGRAYVELKGVGLTKNAIDRLIRQFGSADIVVDLIKTNPYTLISLVRGYGWERADRIALAQGFTTGCKERCLAYAEYRLNKNANEEGNSRINIDNLMNDVSKMCSPTTREQLSAWIKEKMVGVTEFDSVREKIKNNVKDYERPIFFYDKPSRSVGLLSLRIMEKNISEELSRIKNGVFKISFNKSVCEQIIRNTEKKQGYEYTHEQKRAIWDILENNVSILTGSGGTGKSSTLKPIIEIFRHYGCTVAQCALSGRASSLLTEYTGLEGKTIHRLLKYSPDEERFTHSKINPLKEDIIILDESSMVGEELFLSLVSSIKSGAKLLMLGDVKQLPPLAVGNVLSDCIRSGYINTNVLTIIQRQALKSGIISQASQVCSGQPLVKSDFSGEEIRGELKDFKLIAHENPALVHTSVVKEFKRLMAQRVRVDDIQIVVPVRTKGNNSCRCFNEEIQHIVNGSYNPKAITLELIDNGYRFEVTYKPGDRIIITKNNYHARLMNGREVAIFNGNIGHIVDLDSESMIVKLRGENDKIIIPRSDWNNLTHAWAITCHRLQGSQAPYVIIALDSGAFTMLMREWLYTAITRARKYCALIGQPQAINTATRYSNIKTKQTWLKDDLISLAKEKES